MTETEKAPFDALPTSGNVDDFVGKIWYQDAMNLLAALPEKSIDLILTDFPYNITQAEFETELDLEALGKEIFRVIRQRGAVISTAAMPFTAKLVGAWMEYYRSHWIWEKTNVSNFLNAKRNPLSIHEDILVFSHDKLPNYYPVMRLGKSHDRGGTGRGSDLYGKFSDYGMVTNEYYPTSILCFAHDPEKSQTFAQKKDKLIRHPTQKPLVLWEYLVKTYSLQHDIILDPFSGSSTTAIAATNLDRRFVCADSHLPYVEMSRERLARHNPFVDTPLADGKKQRSLFSDIDPASE